MVSLLHYYFLVFAQKDEQLFFCNFQAFFQLLKFLPFVFHFVVVVVVISISGTIFFVGCSITLFFIGVGKTIIFAMLPIVKNKINMRFVVYSKSVGSAVNFWKK